MFIPHTSTLNSIIRNYSLNSKRWLSVLNSKDNEMYLKFQVRIFPISLKKSEKNPNKN